MLVLDNRTVQVWNNPVQALTDAERRTSKAIWFNPVTGHYAVGDYADVPQNEGYWTELSRLELETLL